MTAITKHRRRTETSTFTDRLMSVFPTGDTATKTEPTRIDFVSVLVARHDVTETTAEATATLLEKIRDHAAAHTSPYILTSAERYSDVHAAFDKFMPDGAKASPGSAHDIAEKVFLEEGQHYAHGRTADMCAFQVTVGSS